MQKLQEIQEDNIFDLVLADPPYNIGKDFGNNTDSLALEEYVRWSVSWIEECLRLVKDTGPVYIYGFGEILAHVAVRFPPAQQKWMVWHYTNKTVPSLKFWQRSHEMILCLWKGKRPSINVDAVREPYTQHYTKCAGKPRRETKCRYNTKQKKSTYSVHPKGALPRDVLKTPALAGGAGRAERWFLCRTCGNGVYHPGALARHEGHEVVKHPTQKPMAMARRMLCSIINGGGEKVLVPFAGSGSECVAAHSLGIDFYGIELNPEYVRLAQGWVEQERKSVPPRNF